MPKTSTAFKHPRHMTTEEVVSHLFHPDVVEHIKKEKDKHPKQSRKKSAKKE